MAALQPPYIISSLIIQKKNTSRCSVFLNGTFAFGCTIDTVVRFGLAVGKELSKQDWERLQEQEDIIALKQTALRYATYKPRTAQEVRRKILEKEFAPEEAEYAVQFLEEFGYIDDRKYARAYIKEATERKLMGMNRIKQELQKRGLSKFDIEDALAEAFLPEHSRDAAFETALAAAEKKLRTSIRATAKKDRDKRKQALVGYLQRQGFSWEVIKRVLAEISESDGIEFE